MWGGSLILDRWPICRREEKEWGGKDLAEVSSFFNIQSQVHLPQEVGSHAYHSALVMFSHNSVSLIRMAHNTARANFVWPLIWHTWLCCARQPTQYIYAFNKHFATSGSKKMIKTPLLPSKISWTNKVVIIFKWRSRHWGQWDMEEERDLVTLWWSGVGAGLGKLLRGDCTGHESWGYKRSFLD